MGVMLTNHWCRWKIHFRDLNETSQPVESCSRSAAGTARWAPRSRSQLRRAIRDGALRSGTPVPSTRDLARQLGVSRRVVVDAYAQLAAEGYLLLRQGARPRVSEISAAAGEPAQDEPSAAPIRYDFRPSLPDVSTFPRQAWLRSLREALSTMTDADLGYGDPRGVDALRAALADYLGRVRGVVAEPSRVMVTCGYSQGLDLVCRTLARQGARRIAFEDPSYPEQRSSPGARACEPVAVAVDEQGVIVDELARTGADAVVLTPAHQHPTGVVLVRRAPHRAARLAARQGSDRDRRRLRRRVPLRPRRRRRPPGPRPRARRLRRLGEQDAGAGPADRLARPALPASSSR